MWPNVERRASGASMPIGWVPLRVAFSFALAATRRTLGLTHIQGSDVLAAYASDVHVAPTYDELSLLLQNAPDVTYDDGTARKAALHKPLTMLSADERAIVDAWVELLNCFQLRRVAVDAVKSVDGRWYDRRELLGPAFWEGDFCTVSDGQKYRSGPVVDLNASCLGMTYLENVPNGEIRFATYEDIRVDADQLVECISVQAMRRAVRSAGGAWEISFHCETGKFRKHNGFDYLMVLLANPGKKFFFGELLEAVVRFRDGVGIEECAEGGVVNLGAESAAASKVGNARSEALNQIQQDMPKFHHFLEGRKGVGEASRGAVRRWNNRIFYDPIDEIRWSFV